MGPKKGKKNSEVHLSVQLKTELNEKLECGVSVAVIMYRVQDKKKIVPNIRKTK